MVSVASTLRTAAQHFDAAAALATKGGELPLPNLLFRGRAIAKIVSTYRSATEEAMRGVRTLEPLGAPLEDVRTGVRKALDGIDPRIQYAIETARSNTYATDVPGVLRMHADRLRLRAELDQVAPGAARQRMQDELDQILRVSDRDLTEAQRWRVGVITGLPDGLRPEVPPLVRHNYPLDITAVRGWSPATESMTRGEYRNLRLGLQRRELAADPSVTREALDAEVRSIIARPDAEVTPEMHERLTVIAGMPDDLRPAIVDTPMPWPQHRLSQLSAWGWHPSHSQDARAKYDALRMAVEHERMLADPTLTRAAVERELVELLSLPNELLTKEQLRRTSVLARLPEQLRPDLPPPLGWEYRFEHLGLVGYHPAENRMAAKVFDMTRAHLAATIDPERAAAQLKARIDAGEQVDIRLVAALAKHGDVLERAGLTNEVLYEQSVRALAGAGKGSSSSLRLHLEIARDRLAARTVPDDSVAALRDEAVTLAERNIDRMAGRRSDTFARHPDYAEVGRFVAIADLLDALGPVAAPASSPVDDAARAAETLSW